MSDPRWNILVIGQLVAALRPFANRAAERALNGPYRHIKDAEWAAALEAYTAARGELDERARGRVPQPPRPPPADKLTWQQDGNAVMYRLNGIQIARMLSHPDDRRPISVIRAIRRFAPRFDKLTAAVAIWHARTEEKEEV